MPARLAALALSFLLCAACCSDRGPVRRGADSPSRSEARAKDARGTKDARRCDTLRPRVEALYRAEQGPAPEDEDKRALRADVLQANVHMILEDCRRDPPRFVPCIQRAEDVRELESDCIIPLDDEGKAEGRRFGGD